MGTTFDASKWSIHQLISSDLSVLLHGMSFTHRRYCSAWLQFSFRDRIGSRGCDCPINGWSDGLIHRVGILAILFITWRCISIRSCLSALSSLSPLTCTGLCRLFRSLLWLWLLPLLRVLWLLRLSLSLFFASAPFATVAISPWSVSHRGSPLEAFVATSCVFYRSWFPRNVSLACLANKLCDMTRPFQCNMIKCIRYTTTWYNVNNHSALTYDELPWM